VKLSKPSSFLFILGVMLATGCGTATSAQHAGASSNALAVSSRPAGNPSGGAAERRAAADAKAILGMFVPPPGAVRLPKRPALPDGSPVMGLNSATQADVTGYWRASGAATVLLAWEKAHIARSFSRQDVIIGPPSWNTVYTLPAVPGVLPTREMNVQFYDTGGGGTVIMAEAMVSWQPPRPHSEAVPDSVTEVTIAPSGPWQGNPAPITITSEPTVRRLAALVNGLPLSSVGPDGPCNMTTGFTLTFRMTAGGPPVAVADGPAACGQVSFRLKGKDLSPLLPADAGAYRDAVLKTAGLHWRLG
jgi:hypothetical protein